MLEGLSCAMFQRYRPLTTGKRRKWGARKEDTTEGTVMLARWAGGCRARKKNRKVAADKEKDLEEEY